MADNFEELSYNDLRKRCSELGLGTKGKKGDLVARLQEVGPCLCAAGFHAVDC
jgi:hypothetical protein